MPRFFSFCAVAAAAFALVAPQSAMSATRQPFSSDEVTTVPARRPREQHAPQRSEAPQARSSTIVVIDAGHGGFDRGGIPRQRVAEKTMTLDVALRLRSVLER